MLCALHSVSTPTIPQAHLWLARILRRRLNDPQGAAEHIALFRELRGRPTEGHPAGPHAAESAAAPQAKSATMRRSEKPIEEELIVVSGLPRSGTSMIMQMLEAAGIPILSDGLRAADEDNPRGYFEFEPVKGLFSDNKWLGAVKRQSREDCRLR